MTVSLYPALFLIGVSNNKQRPHAREESLQEHKSGVLGAVMDILRQQVEHVARAFYDVQEETPDWESEPEFLKEEFREYARDALALLEQCREQIVNAA